MPGAIERSYRFLSGLSLGDEFGTGTRARPLEVHRGFCGREEDRPDRQLRQQGSKADAPDPGIVHGEAGAAARPLAQPDRSRFLMRWGQSIS